jgi:hypothetical protein
MDGKTVDEEHPAEVWRHEPHKQIAGATFREMVDVAQPHM